MTTTMNPITSDVNYHRAKKKITLRDTFSNKNSGVESRALKDKLEHFHFSCRAKPCVEIPKYVDTVTQQYQPKFEALLVELQEAEDKSLKESERLEKEIADVKELKEKMSTMTADEYFTKHPDLKKKFDDEIRNDYWGY